MMTNIKKILISTFIFGVFLASSNSVFAITGYYTNSSGNKISSPVKALITPKGASAKCKDGTYSFSKHRSGTCSGHKGVSKWL